jgi:hypothetical protein
MSRRRNPTFVHHRRKAPLFFDCFTYARDGLKYGLYPKGMPVMETVRYKVVFDGLTAFDIPEETVKANLARLFKCDLSRIEPLIQRPAPHGKARS